MGIYFSLKSLISNSLTILTIDHMRKEFNLLFLIAIIATGCSSALTDEPLQSILPPTAESISSRYLTPAQAGEIAAGFMESLGSGPASTRTSSHSVASVSLMGALTKTRASEADTTFYVVNFKDGGYSVVAAEKDLENHVYVYSETGTVTYPMHPVMEDYLVKVAEEIPTAPKRNSSGNSTNGMARKPAYPDSLLFVEGETIYAGIPCYYKCGSSNSSKGPLVKTQWSDWEPYNYFCPANWIYHMPAGCVSVSIGQVFGYHKYPGVFNGREVNWAEMLSTPTKTSINDPGASDIAFMIHEIGMAIKTTYNPGGSYANLNDATTYLHEIGFSKARIVSYNSSECVKHLNSYGPLIMQGSEDENINDIYGIGPGSHAWVVDGHSTTTYYTEYYRKDNWEYIGRVNGSGYTYLTLTLAMEVTEMAII